MKKNYIHVQYENDCPVKTPKDSMWNVLIVRKGLKWASASQWTKAIKIWAVLSLAQYVIKARFIHFQLVTFLSQMKLFILVVLPFKLVLLKSISSQVFKLNITLNRVTNLEKNQNVYWNIHGQLLLHISSFNSPLIFLLYLLKRYLISLVSWPLPNNILLC